MKTSSAITINSLEIEIHSTTISVDGGAPIEPLTTKFNTDDTTVTFQFKDEFKAGSKAVLSIKYTGLLNDKLAGFYRSKHTDDNGVTKYIATTQMEPADARRAFPGFDEPALKATYDITLIHEKEHTALSNMDIKESKTLPNGRISTTFNTTPLMSTYLVAFIVGEFNYVESNLFRVPVRVYTTPGLEKRAQFSADLGARTLEFFEKTFDVPYPLPKMDMIGIHDFSAGAMENWGLVTYRVVDLLYDEKTDSAGTKQRVAEVVQHELAHQWFGDLVTMEWWDGLWLNEGFATWMSWFSCNEFYPDWRVWETYVGDNLQASLGLDALRSSHPIEVPVSKADEINQIFDAISYSKGSSVLKMLANYVGEENFIKGVSNYLKKHKYGNTKTEDLWDALEKQSGKDVSGVMGVWTKKVGFPVVSVEEDGTNITVTQHRFLNTGDPKPEEDETIYPINLALRTKDGIDESILLESRTSTFTVKDPSFFKLNGDQAGIYRVKYSPERVSKLVKSPELLSVEDRMGLIADSRALASSGYAKTSAFLELINGWKKESEPNVWDEVLGSYAGVKRAWLFQPKAVNDALKKLQGDLVQHKSLELGWEITPNDGLLVQQLKANLYSAAVGAEIPSFVDDALDKFKRYNAGNESAIDPNLRAAVFRAAGKYGGKEAFDKLLDIYNKKSSVEGLTAVRSLGYSPDKDLRAKALDFTIDGTVRTQDVSYILAPFSTSTESIDQAWSWFKVNWDKLSEIYPASLGLLARVVGGASAGFSTKEQLAEFEAFFADKNTKGYDQTLANTKDRLQAYISWTERDSKDVEEWLVSNGYLDSSKL